MDNFYVHLSSDQFKDIYATNTPADFKVQLPERIELQGTWTCALAEIEYTLPTSRMSSDANLYMNTNLCDGSFLGNTKQPILRCLPVITGTYSKVYSHLQYYPIKAYQFDVIHIYI